MIELLDRMRSRVADVCKRFGVRRLDVFGSAADGSFDPATSDIDFLVEFEAGVDLGPWLTKYFELQSELQPASFTLFSHR
jgi:predicted nucleotidyltransferase